MCQDNIIPTLTLKKIIQAYMNILFLKPVNSTFWVKFPYIRFQSVAIDVKSWELEKQGFFDVGQNFEQVWMQIGNFIEPEIWLKGYFLPLGRLPVSTFLGFLRLFRLAKIANFHPNLLKILSDVNEPLFLKFPAFYVDSDTLELYIWKFTLKCAIYRF